MNLRRFYQLAAIVVLLQLLATAWGFAQVGFAADVPIHWDVSGHANGFAPAGIGFLLVPAITAGIVLLLGLIPRLEPRRANLLRSSSAYVTVAVGMLLLMLGVHLVTVGAGIGLDLPIPAIIGAGVGLLFALLGNVMTTVRSNFLFGVRTPWTLTSERSWDRTHRLVGRLWVIGGVALFLTSLLGWTQLLLVVVVAFAVGSMLVAVVYSYQVWRQDPDKRSLTGDRA